VRIAIPVRWVRTNSEFWQTKQILRHMLKNTRWRFRKIKRWHTNSFDLVTK
jgi:hypothetical protein